MWVESAMYGIWTDGPFAEFCPLTTTFTLRRAEYNLRSKEGKLDLPKPRKNYLDEVLVRGALLWTNLPQEFRKAGSPGQLKWKIN